jgi:hypothetical protein
MTAFKGRHPKHGDLYTPITPELLELLERMRAEHETWRNVCALSQTKAKVLRNVRQGKRKAISYTFLDRLCSTTGVGGAHEFVWFTADDLVALGIWQETPRIDGRWIKHKDEVSIHGSKMKFTRAQIKKMRKRAKRQELAKINRRRRRLGLPTIDKRYYGKYS